MECESRWVTEQETVLAMKLKLEQAMESGFVEGARGSDRMRIIQWESRLATQWASRWAM